MTQAKMNATTFILLARALPDEYLAEIMVKRMEMLFERHADFERVLERIVAIDDPFVMSLHAKMAHFPNIPAAQGAFALFFAHAAWLLRDRLPAADFELLYEPYAKLIPPGKVLALAGIGS